MHENAKKLYDLLVDKAGAKRLLAKEFGVTWHSIGNWLVNGAPEKHELRMVELLQNIVRQQNEKHERIRADVMKKIAEL